MIWAFMALFACQMTAQCPDKLWDASNMGSAYVDGRGNKAIYGNFTNLAASQYVNDGRLYLFGDIRNNGHIGDGFGQEYIYTCDSIITVISGNGTTEFNILDVNNTGGVDLKKEMMVKTRLRFSNGIIHTTRSLPGERVTFLNGATHLAASDTRHINGTIKRVGQGPFVYPLGDGDHLAQLKVRGFFGSDEFVSAYYSRNLNVFEWLAPGIFHVDSMDFNIIDVQPHEFWTLEGTRPTEVTLYWTSYSEIHNLVNDINDLVVVGWKDGKWRNLGKTDLVQVFNTGTITSRNIIPNDYEALTFGVADTDGDGIADSQDEDPFDPCNPMPTIEACTDRICVELNASVYLEGALMSGGIGRYGDKMRAALQGFGYLPGQIPQTLLGVATDAGQPYFVDPWQYDGSEGQEFDEINDGPDAIPYAQNAVDWVLVSLRSSPQSTSTLCRKAALLLDDGTVQLTEFFDCCNLVDTAFYIVIEHRNHLPVMSHEPVVVTDGTLTYDFRTQQSYQVLLGYGQKEVRPGEFAMYAGNGDQITSFESPTDINTNDVTLWARDNGKHSGYYFQDYDLNGDVNVHDKAIWLLNNGVFTDVPR